MYQTENGKINAMILVLNRLKIVFETGLKIVQRLQYPPRLVYVYKIRLYICIKYARRIALIQFLIQ